MKVFCIEEAEASPIAIGKQLHNSVSSTGRRLFRVTDEKRSFCKLWKLATQPITIAVVRPKDYFAASNELTALALIVCWLITVVYDYRQAWDHPARRFVGHLNPCFGWDYPPASYFAVAFAGLDVFFSMRYTLLEDMRTKLLDADGVTSWSEHIATITARLHAFASILWLLLWQVGPPDNNWIAHLSIFTTCVLLRYLCALGNYLEQLYGSERQRRRVKLQHMVFIVFYGIVTGILPILYFTDIIVYRAQKREGINPPIPWPIVQIFDVTWMICLASTTAMAVPEPPIQITHKVLEFDEEYEVKESESMLGFKDRLGNAVTGIQFV